MKTKPAADTLTYLAGVRRMIVNAGKRVGKADTEELAVLIALRTTLDDAITTAIRTLHYEQQLTWQTIGEATGTTRQAVLMRYGRTCTSTNDCGHTMWADTTHCAEMACANFLNKCREHRLG